MEKTDKLSSDLHTHTPIHKQSKNALNRLSVIKALDPNKGLKQRHLGEERRSELGRPRHVYFYC